jgi:hypothetical protein
VPVKTIVKRPKSTFKKPFYLCYLYKQEMKKIYFTLIGLLLVLPACFSMNDGDSTKKCLRAWRENHYIDVSIGLGDNIVNSSLQWDKLFPVANNRIKIGFGVRMNVANHWKKSFFTAPPQRTNGMQDTLTVDQQTVYYCNLMFVTDFVLLKWWDAGMNIDLVGASWGPQADGSYYSHAYGDNGTRQTISPETLNLMLFGRNDFGNLNSQFYLRFWPSNNVSIKAGMSLGTYISHTDNALNNGNTRFNSASYMGFLSLGWTPGRNAWKEGTRRKIKPIIGTPSF